MNEHGSPNTELHGDKDIQEACDPFVFPRYRVRPGMVRVSDRTQTDEKRQTFESGRFERRC